MAEWLKASVSKTDVLETVPEVRILLPPPFDALRLLMAGQQGECPERSRRAMNTFFTYIILTSNNKYYVGHTNNLAKRFEYHEKGFGAKFTKKNRPLKVIWSQQFEAENDAIKRERQIKGWSRIKKEKLTSGAWK